MDIFNQSIIAKQCINILRKGNEKNLYLHDISRQITEDKLSLISRDFSNALVHGFCAPHGLKNVTRTNVASTSDAVIQSREDHNVMMAQDDKFDLIISNLTMQYNNDVVGALIQYKRLLQNKGLFICNMLGGETLSMLKKAALMTDIQLFNSACNRIIPMVEIKKMGGLLQRAGFSIPFCSSEVVEVEYANVLELLHDLKRMGLGNYMNGRKWPFSKKYFNYLEDSYRNVMIEDETKAQSSSNIVANFEIITACGSVG